jgi:copper(I)-binding protein
VIRIPGKAVASGLLIGAMALLVPAVAGCEAGTDAPTLEFHDAGGGAYANAGDISISNAFVLGAPTGSAVPASSSAGLFLSLSNTGASDDKLVKITAPGWASSVDVTGGTVSIPANSPVNLTGPQPSLVLTNLTKPLAGGEAIPVTLEFQQAGSVTLEVPVEPQAFFYSTFSPPPAATTTPTATPTGTPTP